MHGFFTVSQAQIIDYQRQELTCPKQCVNRSDLTAAEAVHPKIMFHLFGIWSLPSQFSSISVQVDCGGVHVTFIVKNANIEIGVKDFHCDHPASLTSLVILDNVMEKKVKN